MFEQLANQALCNDTAIEMKNLLLPNDVDNGINALHYKVHVTVFIDRNLLNQDSLDGAAP